MKLPIKNYSFSGQLLITRIDGHSITDAYTGSLEDLLSYLKKHHPEWEKCIINMEVIVTNAYEPSYEIDITHLDDK